MTVTPAQVRALAVRVAARSADAYSADRYASWIACAEVLLRRGYRARQVERILRSIFTRWAADASKARHGRATSADLTRFIDKCRGQMSALLDAIAGMP